MARYCFKCGSPLDENGRCPRCEGTTNGAAAGSRLIISGKKIGEHGPRTESPAPAGMGTPVNRTYPKTPRGEGKKPGTKSGKKTGSTLLIVLIVIGVLILACIVIGALQLTDVINVPFVGKTLAAVGLSCAPKNEKEDASDSLAVAAFVDKETLEIPDINSYLSEYGRIVGVTPTESSAACESEAQAISTLRERGFTEYPITTRYAMDGTNEDYHEVSENSTARHPIYETYFISEDGAVWTISEINGRVIAFPATYNEEGLWSVRHIVAESDTYLYYDSIDNKFYEIAPDPSKTVIIRVDRIDADTLARLTEEEVAYR